MTTWEKEVRAAAEELARSCRDTPASLDAKYLLALRVQPNLPSHIIVALDIVTRAAYQAGRNDEADSIANAAARDEVLR